MHGPEITQTCFGGFMLKLHVSNTFWNLQICLLIGRQKNTIINNNFASRLIYKIAMSASGMNSK